MSLIGRCWLMPERKAPDGPDLLAESRDRAGSAGFWTPVPPQTHARCERQPPRPDGAYRALTGYAQPVPLPLDMPWGPRTAGNWCETCGVRWAGDDGCWAPNHGQPATTRER